MTSSNSEATALSQAQVAQFIESGFVRIDGAFTREIAEHAVEILWRDTGLERSDPRTWVRPVVRLGMYSDPPFVASANTPTLRLAYDQLTGTGRWLPPGSVGTFPIRFPSDEIPGDVGWHVDMSFGMESPDFMEWRVNLASRGRLLLMLLLFSDVGPRDAPTVLRVGSHFDIVRRLSKAGEDGLSLRDLAATGFAESAHRVEAVATGEAGTVYLCHPFLVHSAQPHRGDRPRFIAQPPLLPKVPVDPWRPLQEASPVERAIRMALQ